MSKDKPKVYVVKNERNLVRDSFSNAIINKDSNAYMKYLRRTSKETEKREEIEQLKSDVQEIKTLLTKLLERT